MTKQTNKILQGNCLEVLKTLPDNSVDSIVTDPPYHLVSIVKRFGKEGSAPAKEGKDGSFKRLSGGFMGKQWDGVDEDGIGIAQNPELWKECLRVIKPGGHLLAFSGTRTYHRMASAIEDAGFEVRDMIEWVYGSGFPKSLNIGKAINKIDGVEFESKPAEGVGFMNNDKEDGYHPTINQLVQTGESSERAKQWEGWGTALKPAHEPICMARKPLSEKTVAENVLKHGTGGINIDESRVEGKLEGNPNRFAKTDGGSFNKFSYAPPVVRNDGRFPANLIHDNSEEVRGCFPNESERFFKSIIYQAKASKSERNKGCEGLPTKEKRYMATANGTGETSKGMDRFTTESVANNHPTVKPIALMEYLIKMVTPKGGIVLDPFMGSGSTGCACVKNGFGFIGIELESEYIKIAEARINYYSQQERIK